jgi:UDP-N-acetylglucosamine diphosphorylase/glucosamine-1-phosphate N-acetyltransferase
MTQAPAAIILAAGQGTRMKSDLPKVAHRAADAPMVQWVARACAQAGCRKIVIVVGYQQEVVRAIFEEHDAQLSQCEILFAEQLEQQGTGHAAQCAQPLLENFTGDVFVLVGDGPLLRSKTLIALHEHHQETDASCSLATATIEDPAGYGRIVRDGEGQFVKIVEHKEATPEQLEINEINPSIYCFKAAALFASLPRLDRSKTTGEFYITDVPANLMAQGQRVEVIAVADAEDALSVNTPEQLAVVDEALRARLNHTPHPQPQG